ncbi:MAG: hypothetical protein ABJL44_01875 [Algibacter sp.]
MNKKYSQGIVRKLITKKRKLDLMGLLFIIIGSAQAQFVHSEVSHK